jgi:hypothetical protein
VEDFYSKLNALDSDTDDNDDSFNKEMEIIDSQMDPDQECIIKEEVEEDADSDDTEEVIESDEETDNESEIKDEAPQDKEKPKPWKIKRDFFKVKAALEENEEENKRLRDLLNDSVSSNTFHYGENLHMNLDKAQIKFDEALESGDKVKFREATLEFNKATRALEEFEDWKRNESYKKSQQEDNINYNYQQNVINEQKEIASEWISSHPYLDTRSKSYNPEMARTVANYVNNLDNALIQNNQQDLYYSDQYFDTIDNYINQLKPLANKHGLNSRSHPTVSGIKNTNTTMKKPALTSIEREHARAFGLTDEEFLKSKTKVRRV